jgi:tetratricopeptide (TPR) repeat protein
MDRANLRWAIVALAVAVLANASHSADDDALKKKAHALNEITGDAAIAGHLRKMIKDEAGTKQLLAVAVKLAEEKPQPFNYNAAFILARSAQAVKDIEAAQRFYRICKEDAYKLQSPMKLVQVYDGLIDLFYENGKFDETIKACQEFLDLPPKGAEKISPDDRTLQSVRPFVQQRMIQAMARKGRLDEALKLTDELIEQNGDKLDFYNLKALVLREADKLEEAAQVYQDIIERIKKNEKFKEEQRDRLADRTRYFLSGIYVDMKQIDKAADILQALLKKQPDNPTYNNDLGFIWADHDMNLDESEKLIRKAIEEDRKQRKKDPDLTPEEDMDNAAYLDSLGWVLFKKKDYKEAKKHLLEAIEQQDGQHIEILDHLADVHMALGEKEDAVKVWKKALALEADSKRDKARKEEIAKKVKKTEASK